MFAKERQNHIYTMLQEEGAVTTPQLVAQFGVSTETIRRDLLQMEQNGRLHRVHGGAIPNSDITPFRELSIRHKEFTPQKKALSSRAADFIQDGDILAIDSGSTAISLAHVLKKRFSKLTILTHSLDVFEILQDHKDFSVILCGGFFLSQERAFYGPLTLEMFHNLRVQKAFVCPSGISLTSGICEHDAQLYPLQRKLMQIADQVFILADSSKFEKRALFKSDDMKQEYIYITDDGLSGKLKDLYAENELRIYIGGSNP